MKPRTVGKLERRRARLACADSYVGKRHGVGTTLSPCCWYQQKYQQLVRLAAHFGEHWGKCHQLSHGLFVTFGRPRTSANAEWCPWRESNPHSLRNTILSRARLPVPPHGLKRMIRASRPPTRSGMQAGLRITSRAKRHLYIVVCYLYSRVLVPSMGRHSTSPADALASARRAGKLPQSAAMSIANRGAK